jgi:signal transduction histidine kinase
VHLAELFRSTPFRFAVALTAGFLVAFLVAGSVALRTIDADLSSRIVEATELAAERLEDRYQEAGKEALIAAVEARAVAGSEDEIVWLGAKDGTRLAGRALAAPLELTSGDFAGSDLVAGEDDLYRLEVRDLGDLRLIVGRSYEEADEIRETVLGAFGWAAAIVLALATTAAALLAASGQRRLDAITATLRTVSRGGMKARVPVSGLRDDLDRLAAGINDALGQLEATVEGIRQVSSDVAHDLRTPIHRLAILLERARAAAEGHAELELALDEAAGEVDGITATFDALLRIAQIEAGARRARFTPVPLAEIADALHAAYLPVAEEYGKSLTYVPPPGRSAWVLGDRALLTQLYANLIENALRHCPQGATVRIETGMDGDSGWMLVADDGPGIPEGEQANVVKRFYRLDKSRHSPGSGLGLALVKAISDLHGAALIFGDAEPGLTVRLAFPALENGAVQPCA